MAMSNDLSHLLVKLLWNGFAACALSTPPCGTLPSRPQAASETVKVAFSAPYRKATGLSEAVGLEVVVRYQRISGACKGDRLRLHAPAISLGVFKRTLHLFPQNFREDRPTH